MNCNAGRSKKLSKNKALEFALVAVAYSMFEGGKTEEEVDAMLKNIEYVAELFADDYATFLDIRKTLKSEYGYELRFKE